MIGVKQESTLLIDVVSIFHGLRHRFGSEARLDFKQVVSLVGSCFPSLLVTKRAAVLTRRYERDLIKVLELFDYEPIKVKEGLIDATLVSAIHQEITKRKPVILLTGNHRLLSVLPLVVLQNTYTCTFENLCATCEELYDGDAQAKRSRVRPITKNWLLDKQALTLQSVKMS